MAVKDYSTTAGSNTSVAGINIAEGCPAANINNGMRAMMADTRSFYENTTWLDMGHAVSRTGATTFTINSDVTALYTTGRRIRCTDSSTLYGSIVSSSYSVPNTTVTVTLDSGSLSASLTAVALSVIDPTGDPISASSLGGTVASANIDTAVTGFLVPIGAVMPYAASAAPTGWLLCQGQAVSRTTYSALFSAIGTTYGIGDGSTTFNLPDLGGRVVAGRESVASRLTSGVSGVDGGTLGASGGNQNMHQHTHGVTDAGHFHVQAYSSAATFAGRYGKTDTGINGQIFESGSASTDNFGSNTSTATTGLTINNAGTGSSQNVQPTIVLNYIIKH